LLSADTPFSQLSARCRQVFAADDFQLMPLPFSPIFQPPLLIAASRRLRWMPLADFRFTMPPYAVFDAVARFRRFRFTSSLIDAAAYFRRYFRFLLIHFAFHFTSIDAIETLQPLIPL